MAIKLHEIDRTVYFKEIALVIGKRKARKELRNILKTKHKALVDGCSHLAGMDAAFVWKYTPQGSMFWINIHRELNRIKMQRW